MRHLVTTLLLLAGAVCAQDASVLMQYAARPNPLAGYAQRENIIGFYDCRYASGSGPLLNTDTNSRATWKDLSGYGRNLTLSSFNFTATNGWAADYSLAFNGANGTVTGLVSGCVSNYSVMVVVGRGGKTALQILVETSENINVNTGGSYISLNQVNASNVLSSMQESGAVFYDYTAAQSLATGQTYAVTLTLQSTNTGAKFGQTYIGTNSAVTVGSDGRNLTPMYNGVFYLGSRGGSQYFLLGRVYLVIMWNATLTASEVAANLAKARAEFGF